MGSLHLYENSEKSTDNDTCNISTDAVCIFAITEVINIQIPKENRPPHKGLRITGTVLLILSLLMFVWVMGGAVAYGWILHADHYGAAFAAYGKCYFAAAGGMTLAVILCLCKKDLPAIVLGILSYVPMLMLMLKAIGIAEEYGWSGQTEQSFGRNASMVWRNGMMWNAVPLILLLVLCLTRWLSYDASARRAQKRAEKEAAENAAAPSILADTAETAVQSPTPVPMLRQKAAKTAANRKDESSKQT